MPQGTFHQMRNVSSCLSYSSFHLDTLNIPAFVQSFMDDDALEIDHRGTLWNAGVELISRVDGMTDAAALAAREGGRGPSLTDEERNVVETLRMLRHNIRALDVRMNERKVAATGAEAADDDYVWGKLVDDIDLCLHEFKHRREDPVPKFVKVRDNKKVSHRHGGDVNVVQPGSPSASACEVEQEGSDGASPDGRECEVYRAGGMGEEEEGNKNTLDLNDYLSKLPVYGRSGGYKKCPSLGGPGPSRSVGGSVVIAYQSRVVPCVVSNVVPSVSSAIVAYDGYESEYDETHPLEMLKLARGNGREQCGEGDAKVGVTVFARWGATQVSFFFEEKKKKKAKVFFKRFFVKP